jgi:hypothetical protein
MKLRDTKIAWNPRGGIQVGSRHEHGWDEGYRRTTGGVCFDIRAARGEAAKVFALAEFHAIVLRDGVRIRDAHREFLKIDEYRDAIAPELLP